LDLVTKNRSYRRFKQEVPVSLETLKELVNLARLSASGANRQPLKYFLSAAAERNRAIFPCLGWAGYLKDWSGPSEGERPAAYIVILGDKGIADYYFCDHGIAGQNILLGAAEKGLGGCFIGNVQRDRLRAELKIPETMDILLVIALGVPAEKVVLEDIGPSGDIRYYRDAQSIHHVPKRKLQDLIIGAE
jgi:nitroreductase